MWICKTKLMLQKMCSILQSILCVPTETVYIVVVSGTLCVRTLLPNRFALEVAAKHRLNIDSTDSNRMAVCELCVQRISRYDSVSWYILCSATHSAVSIYACMHVCMQCLCVLCFCAVQHSVYSESHSKKSAVSAGEWIKWAKCRHKHSNIRIVCE